MCIRDSNAEYMGGIQYIEEGVPFYLSMATVFDQSKVRKHSVIIVKKNQVADSTTLLQKSLSLKSSESMGNATKRDAEILETQSFSPPRRRLTFRAESEYDDQNPITKSDSPSKTKTGILKIRSQSANNLRVRPRSDTFGNPILRGGKKHKIQFHEKLEKMHMVESWKVYNSTEYAPSSCSCAIMQEKTTQY
eukprot:TRINITY_DN24768_c0_g1_i1.p1 TRINITY_DN24768_c0_g1~~TRINITY_DN24768_c0_g1_i1.p1  ORF type:complete len:211 (+),score=25.97 TRINITY_DN24768_c0_g1_i1:58-633(+)